MKTTQQAMSLDSKLMLDCLRATAAKTLEKKKRLGHYAVLWADGRPVIVGEDAPAPTAPTVPQDR